jgi:peptidoglycan-associated lipoprotein
MKMWKSFFTGLAIVLAILAPACRSSRKKVDTKTTTATSDTGAPIVEDVRPTETRATETAMPEQRDFVQEQEPREELIPSDIEAANRFVHERGLIRDAFFEYDAATLDADAQAALTASAAWMRNNAGYSLLIEGHCDERGTEQYNLALGDRRANTAKEFLMSLGIAGERIRTVSYGEERPFEEGHDDTSWRQNRRAHLVLVR